MSRRSARSRNDRTSCGRTPLDQHRPAPGRSARDEGRCAGRELVARLDQLHEAAARPCARRRRSAEGRAAPIALVADSRGDGACGAQRFGLSSASTRPARRPTT
jgi:hypothetical protein